MSNLDNRGDRLQGSNAHARQGLSRPVRAVLLSLVAVAAVFEHELGGWGGPITMAAVAVVAPIFLFRKLWNRGRFWITATLLGTLQVPLVAAVRPMIEQAQSFYMLAFVMVDGLFVIIVISLACPKSNGEGT